MNRAGLLWQRGDGFGHAGRRVPAARVAPLIRGVDPVPRARPQADTWGIDRLSLALRLELGLKACRVIDNVTRRSFAEADAEWYEKAEDRADRSARYGADATDPEAFKIGTTSSTTTRPCC